MHNLFLPLLVTLSIGNSMISFGNDLNTNIIEPFPFEVNEQLIIMNEKNKSVLVKPEIKYTHKITGIYSEPIKDEKYILDYSLINTSFEVVKENEVWATITTSNGFAFMLKEDLEKHPVSELYNEKNLEIMAHLLSGECQYCPDQEQLYVGSVALNRIKDSRFPNTLEEVVFQKSQYSCTIDGNYYREPTEANWRNAEWLLKNGSVFPEHVIYQSGGKQGKGVYLKTDYHYYCY